MRGFFMYTGHNYKPIDQIMRNKFLIAFVALLGISSITFAEQLPDPVIQKVKADLSDKILTKEEINKGTENTQLLYFSCLIDTAKKLKMMYPDSTKQTITNTVNHACEYSEDKYNTYSVLLAASTMNKPMSEKQAFVFIEKNYNEKGRAAANADQRTKILKYLKIVD